MAVARALGHAAAHAPRDGQTQLFRAVSRGEPAAALASQALVLAEAIEGAMPGFFSALARTTHNLNLLHQSGRDADTSRLGARLAEAGLFTREAFATHAACHALRFDLVTRHRGPAAAAVLDVEPGLKFDVALPAGVRTAIRSLVRVAEGRFVRIGGLATAFQQRRTADGKLLGTVSITDPASGATAQAVGLFAHFPHAGLTSGAYVLVNGNMRKSSALLQGQPGVEIDLLPLAQMAKASWRMRLLRLGSTWSETWRNGLNIAWSIGPHRRLPGDAADALFGAGELVFTPFVRDQG